MAVFEQMLAIVAEKGPDLSQDDLVELDYLTTKLDIDDAFEQRGIVDEAIALIVNDPLYEGDIDPMD